MQYSTEVIDCCINFDTGGTRRAPRDKSGQLLAVFIRRSRWEDGEVTGKLAVCNVNILSRRS